MLNAGRLDFKPEKGHAIHGIYYDINDRGKSCSKEEIMEVEKPTINSRIVRSPSTEPQDLCVYGSTVVEFYGDHVRISLDDWNKYKQRLIPVLKQGDMKYGSTETGS